MPMKLYPDVRTFPELIKKIADKHYGGAYHRLAVRMRRSSGLIYAWRDGKVRVPRGRAAHTLAKLHDLDIEWVFSLMLSEEEKRMQTVTILVEGIEAGERNADGGRSITIGGKTHGDGIGLCMLTFPDAAAVEALRSAIDSK